MRHCCVRATGYQVKGCVSAHGLHYNESKNKLQLQASPPSSRRIQARLRQNHMVIRFLASLVQHRCQLSCAIHQNPKTGSLDPSTPRQCWSKGIPRKAGRKPAPPTAAQRPQGPPNLAVTAALACVQGPLLHAQPLPLLLLRP
jgi:hypothetical protein